MVKKGALILIVLSLFTFLAITVLAKESMPDVLLQIKEILSSILEKLNIIAERNESIQVNVEPNITVSPQINLNPNITLPEKECKWETYSQVFIPNLESPSGFDYFEIPEGVLAREINVTKAFALFENCGSHNITVNDIQCFFIGGGSGREYRDMDCLNAFKVGLNKIEQQQLFGPNCRRLEKVYLEMEVKPANC